MGNLQITLERGNRIDIKGAGECWGTGSEGIRLGRMEGESTGRDIWNWGHFWERGRNLVKMEAPRNL